MQRIMGTEVEYGISVAGRPDRQPDAHVVPGRQRLCGSRGDPARRARGGTTRRSRRCATPAASTCRARSPTPASSTDEDIGLANVILTNGARLYVDHAHPEYSTPEVTNPLDVVLWDKAGERVMLEAAARRPRSVPGAPADPALQEQHRQQGRLVRRPRELPDAPLDAVLGDIVRHLTPFFVSRQVVCGAGRVGIGQDGREHGFQISQRADFFEVEVGLETTLKRPIINTRDEPHADAEKYRRLHVIIGDANLAEVVDLPQGRHHLAGARR